MAENTVEAKLTASDEGLTAALERIESALYKLNQTCEKLGEIMIKTQDAGATKVVQAVQSQVENLAKSEATPEIKAEDRASPEVEKVEEKIETLNKAGAEPVIEAKDEVSKQAEKAAEAVESIPDESVTAMEADNQVTPAAEQARDSVDSIPESSTTAIEADNEATPAAKQASDSIDSIPEESMTALEADNHVTPAANQARDSVDSLPDSKKINLNADNNASDEINEVTEDLEELEDTADRVGNSLGNALSGGSLGFGIGSSLGGKAFEALSAGFKGVTIDAVEAGKTFDASMSKVAALQGEKLGADDFEMLSEAAKQAGATTQFSATQAADALQYMALAGWDAQKSADTLPSILNLAAAADMDLAQASDTVTDYLSAFSNSMNGAGTEALSAAEMVDIMAFAQANSNTSADQLGEAWRNCAANLNAAGQDVQTTTSFLEAMANQGLKGSEAGTAMAAMMRDITAQMENGCIKIGETSVAVKDEYGNFRDLTEIMTKVEEATNGMGDAERAAALSATFTADSQRGLNLLLNEGMDKVAGYEKALRSCSGAAETAAEKMNDNLAGDLKTLSSAWEAVQISIASKVEPALRTVTQAATKVLTCINDLIKGWDAWNEVMSGNPSEQAQKTFDGLSDPVRKLFVIIDNLKAAWNNFINGFKESGALDALKQAIDAITDAFLSLGKSSSSDAASGAKTLGQAIGGLVKIISAVISKIAEFVGKLDFGGAGTAVAGVAGIIAAFKGFEKLKSMNPLSGFLSKFKKGTGEATQSAESSKSKIAQIFESLGSLLQSAGTAISTVFQGIATAISSLNLTGAASLVVIIAGLTAAFLALAYCKDMVLPFLQGIADILMGMLNTAAEIFCAILERLAPLLPIIAQSLAMLSPLVVAFGQAISLIVEAIGQAVSMIITALVPVIQVIADTFTNVVSIVSGAIVQIVGALAPYIPEITKMVQATSEAIQSICDAFTSLVQEISPIIDSITQLIGQLGESISQVFDSISGIVDSVGGAIRNVLDGISGIFESIGNAALNAGRGFDLFAGGIERICAIGVWDLGANLGALAIEMGKLGPAASSMGDAGTQMQAFGTGLTLVATTGAQAVTALMSLQQVPPVIAQFGTISPILTMAGNSLVEFGMQCLQAMAGITTCATSLPRLTSGAATASSQLTRLSGAAAKSASAFSQLASTADRCGSVMKAAMVMASSAITSAMNKAQASVSQSFSAMSKAAMQCGNAIVSGLTSTLSRVPSVCASMLNSAIATFRSGYGSAYSAGSWIGVGLANGISSQIGAVAAAASRLAAEADRAIQAKAKIGSPSKVTTKDGEWIGIGLMNGINSMRDKVWEAAENLVGFGQLTSGSHGLDLNLRSDELERYGDVNLTIVQDIDGRTWARSTATFQKAEMDAANELELRLKGEWI